MIKNQAVIENKTKLSEYEYFAHLFYYVALALLVTGAAYSLQFLRNYPTIMIVDPSTGSITTFGLAIIFLPVLAIFCVKRKIHTLGTLGVFICIIVYSVLLGVSLSVVFEVTAKPHIERTGSVVSSVLDSTDSASANGTEITEQESSHMSRVQDAKLPNNIELDTEQNAKHNLAYNIKLIFFILGLMFLVVGIYTHMTEQIISDIFTPVVMSSIGILHVFAAGKFVNITNLMILFLAVITTSIFTACNMKRLRSTFDNAENKTEKTAMIGALLLCTVFMCDDE